MKYISAIASAAVLLMLGMAIADFMGGGALRILDLSVAVSLPIFAAALFRIACRPTPKPQKRR